jgi:hypothetical protein
LGSSSVTSHFEISGLFTGLSSDCTNVSNFFWKGPLCTMFSVT